MGIQYPGHRVSTGLRYFSADPGWQTYCSFEAIGWAAWKVEQPASDTKMINKAILITNPLVWQIVIMLDL
jgi:hypothetical protein